ncbi:hypothetical protein PV10_00945 [Exophiala mesophila]|uniref:Uncharacterized protein n=1 Tax=Exophiala mesophila TaxID=212818 RepID=A0A0D2AE44_EXOME|nr:uncharacterized protein PV10_00945 [Exophiala mesophila]KIV97163.1 hypothetical protein PV10_00945 [Exophiala mesophila]
MHPRKNSKWRQPVKSGGENIEEKRNKDSNARALSNDNLNQTFFDDVWDEMILLYKGRVASLFQASLLRYHLFIVQQIPSWLRSQQKR